MTDPRSNESAAGASQPVGSQAAEPHAQLSDLPFETEQRLGLSLSGSLPCITCRYDLKGISIRGVCPECGTMVRATILHRVDPDADVFRPVWRPRLISALLRLWALGALVAALAIWIVRIEEIAAGAGGAHNGAIWMRAALWAIIASAVGSFAFVRPIQGMDMRKTLAALAGTGGYAIVLIGFLGVLRAEVGRAAPYSADVLNTDRILWRLLMMAGVLVVLLGVRPAARELVKRCLALRTGRVDRQTIIAMIVVTLVGMVGDGLRVLAPALPNVAGEVMGQLAVVLVAMSALLLTLGIGSAVVDAWRIGASLVAPSPSLQQVLQGTQSPG